MKTVQPIVFRVWSRFVHCKTCLCFLTLFALKFFRLIVNTRINPMISMVVDGDSCVEFDHKLQQNLGERCYNVKFSQVQNCLHRVLCTYLSHMTATYHLLAKLMLKCKKNNFGSPSSGIF